MDMVNLEEFKQYMSIDGGITDYSTIKAERDARNSNSNEGTLLENGQIDKNYNVASLDNGGIQRNKGPKKPPPGYLDEDRKSDLEDFEDEMNEQNIMNMGMRGNLGMGSINSSNPNENNSGELPEIKDDQEADRNIIKDDKEIETRISSETRNSRKKRKRQSSGHSDI